MMFPEQGPRRIDNYHRDGVSGPISPTHDRTFFPGAADRDNMSGFPAQNFRFGNAGQLIFGLSLPEQFARIH